MSSGRKNGGKLASFSQSVARATQIEQEQQGGGNRKYGNFLVLGKGKKNSGVATGHKINVLKPVNLPSLKKEHEGQEGVVPKGVVSGGSSGWQLKQQQAGEEDISQYINGMGSRPLPQATNWGRPNSKDPSTYHVKQQGVLNPEEFPTLKNSVQKNKSWEESDRDQQSNKYIPDKEVECDWEFEERRVSHLLHDDEDWMKIVPQQSNVQNGYPDYNDNIHNEFQINKNDDRQSELWQKQIISSTNVSWNQTSFDADHMPPGFPTIPHRPPPPPSYRSAKSSKRGAQGSMKVQLESSKQNGWKGSSDCQVAVQRSYYDDRDISSFSDIRINDEMESREIKGGDSSIYSNNEHVTWKQQQFYEEEEEEDDGSNLVEKRAELLSFQQQSDCQCRVKSDPPVSPREQLQEIDAEMIARYGIGEEEEEEEEDQWHRWHSSDPLLKFHNSRSRQEIRDPNFYQMHTTKPKTMLFEPPVQHPNPPPFKSKVVGIKMDKQLQAQGIQLPEDLHPDQCSSDAVVTPTTTHTQQSLGVVASTGQYVESSIRRLPNDLTIDTPTPTYIYKPTVQQPPPIHVTPQLYRISHAQQQQQYTFTAAPHQHIGLGVSVGVGVAPNPNPNPNSQLEQQSQLQPIDCVISGLQVGRQQNVDNCGYVGGWQQYINSNNRNWSGMEQVQVPVLVTPLPAGDSDQQIEYKINSRQKVVSRSVQTNTPEDCSWYQGQENDSVQQESEDVADVVEVSRVRRHKGNRVFNGVNRGRSRGGYSSSRGGRVHWAGNDWRRGDARSRRGHIGFRMRGGGVRDSSRGRTSSQSARSQ